MPDRIPLSRIRGEDIGTAQRALPTCDRDSPSTMTADVDVTCIGRVRITFAKMNSKQHRSYRWFWVVDSAELLNHICDGKGTRATVIDESGNEPITAIYPTCSVCGVPQIFDK